MSRRSHCEAETILSERCAGVNRDAVADQTMHYYGAGADIAISANCTTVSDNGAGTNVTARTNLSFGANHDARFDADPILNLGRARNPFVIMANAGTACALGHRTGMMAVRIENIEERRKRFIRLRNHQR